MSVDSSVVFSQWTTMLDLVEIELRRRKVGYSRLDGSMKRADRTNAIVSFQTDPETVVMLVSIKAGGVGYVFFTDCTDCRLNLTAASHVFVFEPAWNPAIEQQAIDRVHRLTQKIDVIVYKITIKDSVEERILDLQEKKRELANQTIEGGKGGAGKLGIKEILQLFRRDAEYAPPHTSAAQYDLEAEPRTLKEVSTVSGGGLRREGSAAHEPKVIPPGSRPASALTREDAVYGRRW